MSGLHELTIASEGAQSLIGFHHIFCRLIHALRVRWGQAAATQHRAPTDKLTIKVAPRSCEEIGKRPSNPSAGQARVGPLLTRAQMTAA